MATPQTQPVAGRTPLGSRSVRNAAANAAATVSKRTGREVDPRVKQLAESR